jgi:hypothetical protein
MDPRIRLDDVEKKKISDNAENQTPAPQFAQTTA